jgi:HEAT repeat protein
VTIWIPVTHGLVRAFLMAFAAALSLALVSLVVYRGIDELRFLRRQRLLARYRPLVDAVLTAPTIDAAVAPLLPVPPRHRSILGDLILTVARLQTGDVVPRLCAAASALGLVDHWMRDVSHRSWWVRAAAVRALGLVREPSSVAVLLRALDEPHAEVRAAAADALGRIADPAVGPALLARLRDESRHQRARLIEAIRAQGAPMMPALLAHARASAADTAATLDVVGIIGDTSAIDSLLDWSGAPDPAVRSAALKALGSIGLDDRSYYYALRGLEDAHPDARAMAARALGRSGRRDAVPYLRAHLDDEWIVAAHCATGLRRLGREGAAALQQRAATGGQGGDLATQMLWELNFLSGAAHGAAR